ncbi:phosphoglycolate phosphatase, HAD superfamily [Candidatus Brocadia pituitae]|nr:phosphoglycolate phosphatase, HAD superfamily [Candidatus Brocadia pituitae]
MLRGIIFDMDGTLTKPNVDFAAIEREIGAKVGFIIDYAERSTPEERKRALDILERYEAQAAMESELNEGVVEMLEFVSKKQLKKALLTRNSRKSVETVLRKHKIHFEFIVSREDTKPKPAPDPIFLLSKKMNIHTDHLLMVGDYKYDILCGKAAGTKTVLLRYKEYIETEVTPDFEINSIREIIDLIIHFEKLSTSLNGGVRV